MLRDPFGINGKAKNLGGILTISYDNFISHFHLVEINYFKNFTEENNVKIENKETMRCQIIEITNEHDNNEIIIN